MRRVNVSETRENLAQLLAAVESGEEIVIMRRDTPIAKLVPIPRPMLPSVDRRALRDELPPMVTSAQGTVRQLQRNPGFGFTSSHDWTSSRLPLVHIT